MPRWPQAKSSSVQSALSCREYSVEIMTWIIAAWSAITLSTAVGCAPSSVLQTFRRYRTLAFGSVYGAVISMIGVAVLLLTLGVEWSLLGILMGEAFLARYMLVHALRSIRNFA